jgi:membrane associated rhomboid family serine protease
MSKCDACGKTENMPYRCHHCGGTYCSEHRLPEAHDCPGLDNWGDPDGVFDSGFDESVDDRGGSGGGIGDRLSVDTGPGSFLGYFRGNATYTMLGLMWITFLLEHIVALFGIPIGGSTWSAIFTLQPQHPEYVWTWVTSVFSHAPVSLGHIALNSIIIFFFGRIVEDYIGSKKFAILFVATGALAGLGQIGLSHLLVLLDYQSVLGPGVLGASGAGLAIMGVLTVLNPSLRVYLYFLIPVPIWAITGFYLVISVGGILGVGGPFTGGNVADMAHLVGLVAGLWYGSQVKGQRRTPNELQFGGGGRGPGGPGRGRF